MTTNKLNLKSLQSTLQLKGLMNILKLVLSFQLVLGLSSCSDFLNTSPMAITPETYFQNKAQVQSFLISVYAPLQDASIYGDNYVSKITAEDLGYYQRVAPVSSVICGSTNVSDPTLLSLWRSLYDGINRANMLLENIDTAMPASSDSVAREQYRSEARFLRAYL